MIKVHATFTLTVGRTVFREDKSVFKGDSSSLTWQLARRKGSDRKKVWKTEILANVFGCLR